MSKKAKSRNRPGRLSSEPAEAFPWSRAAALATGVVPALLALIQFPYINGTPYWPWRYYGGEAGAFAAGALVVWAAVCWADQRVAERHSPMGPVVLLAVLHVSLILGFTALGDKGLSIVGERVAHPDITSYHTEAAKIEEVGPWLRDYDKNLRGMIGHAQTHPPGPILYYLLWIQMLGVEAGAQWGGVFLALLGGLAIPLLYCLVRTVTGSDLAGFAAAAVWTPLPAVIHMLGSLDAVYPLFTLGLAILWIGACWRGSRAQAAWFGALLCLALLFTHSLLTLGALFLLLGLAPIALGVEGSGRPAKLLEVSGIAAAVCAGLFGLLWLMTGYNHLARVARVHAHSRGSCRRMEPSLAVDGALGHL